MKPVVGWFIAGCTAAAVAGGAIALTIRQPVQRATAPSLSPATVSPPPVASASPVVPVASPTPVTSSPAPAVTPAPPATTPSPKEKLTAESRATIYGVGPVRVGMTLDEARQAAGIPITLLDEEASPGCRYAKPAGMNEGIGLMVIDNRIARIDIWDAMPIKTRSGLGIGSTKAEILQRFPGQIEEQPHEYVPGGQYLLFVPKDAADQNYRIVFETDPEGVVTQYRVGRLPEVRWIEGCA